MNITKLNKKRMIINIIIFNIIFFILFIGISYFIYLHLFDKALNVVKYQQEREALSVRKVVKKYYNKKKLLAKYVAKFESRRPFKVYITDNKSKLVYPDDASTSLRKTLQKEDGYYIVDDSIYFFKEMSVIGHNNTNVEIKVVLSKAAITQLKNQILKKVLYKGGALYLIIAYILSMLILIISRLNYDKFQTRIFGDLIKHTNDGIIITDKDGDIIFGNDSFLRIFNTKLKEIRGENISKFNSNIHDKEFFKSMWGQLNREGNWEGDVINTLNDGSKIFTKLKITTIVNKKSKNKYYICVYEDKTDFRMQKIDILKLQLYDSFSGLPNRTYTKKYLEKLIASKSDFAFLNICINNFKDINDVYGFEIANKVLLQYIEKIKEIFGNTSFTARIDGRKICVVIDAFNVSFLKVKLQDISNISKTPFRIFSESILVASNASLSFYPETNITIDKMLNAECKNIEILLKGESLKKISAVIKEKEDRKDEMIKLLKTAVENNELSISYQPRIDSNDNTLVGAEALIRWSNKKLGNISPMYFIPLAEKCGYIDEITEWTVKELCKQLDSWKKEMKTVVPVSINVSPLSIRNKDFTDKFIAEFKRYKLNREDIQIEITEKAINNSTCGDTKESINKLSKEGFKIMVDNFGTGNSKLDYLKKLDISTLKIDREFIKNYPEKDDGSIAKIIISMAESLQLDVVGEGTENIEQVNFLRTNGCHILQGYHFSKPLHVKDFEEILKKMKV